ncbi:hypothetical protein CONCODRAFT_11385 [Conidiobolus coronatus NRRL 28638]|uniref:Poly(A) RNA polymerase mitochondrial-like central palm domain-containing protein n=1 Tax=Conidiobolus coronatus (strain ATCC 28846 / CBS 209.66 / NRRL 28638) TaxID=796925 RepID=A0A137NVG4_CONC2|nr:hypothetical protein CONCODRAFT_11385 [Conidiobolus coronatus NRRL 28638]|eukprot:KXN66698.1 hypothetical protein CONCODRAFT_11385 [Conidiobolus coronatus NRRL 28638]
MQRFPDYKDILEIENRVKNDGIPNKLLFNYIIQILRRLKTEKELNVISNVVKYISNNLRFKYMNLEEDHLLSLIEENPKIFKLKVLKSNDGKDLNLIIPLPEISDYQSLIRKKPHSYINYESYEDILNQLKMKPSNYIIANSIYNRIEQILNSRFNYNITVIKYGSVPINLAAKNSGCDALIQFPENFSLNYINVEFEKVKRYFQESGYKFISEWKTSQGSRVLRFKDYNSDFIIDIGVYEEILVKKTNLISAYCNLHPDIYDTIMLIKIWADRRKLNSPDNTHVVSSYCHVLMFITYLIIIGAVPNLRTIPPGFRLWKAKEIEYSPEINPLQNSGPDKICSGYCELISYENTIIPIYFNKDVKVELGYNWDTQKVITGYFYFMGFEYNYRDWDISIYHGNIVESSVRVDSIDSQTKLLRVRNPFKLDQIESNAALPWCIDGLKWEFTRGYKLLCNSNWNELYNEAIPPSAEDLGKLSSRLWVSWNLGLNKL